MGFFFFLDCYRSHCFKANILLISNFLTIGLQIRGTGVLDFIVQEYAFVYSLGCK